jgi:hypothetical protein
MFGCTEENHLSGGVAVRHEVKGGASVVESRARMSDCVVVDEDEAGLFASRGDGG